MSVASNKSKFYLDDDATSIQMEWDEDYDGLTDLPEDDFNDLLARLVT